jgi:hypothetical protein
LPTADEPGEPDSMRTGHHLDRTLISAGHEGPSLAEVLELLGKQSVSGHADVTDS